MPTTADRKLRVFLCHSSQDKPIVRELYQRLNAEGWIDPWLDEEKLFPGMDWDVEIEKAVEAADAVIVFLSNGSVTKEGYVQRELRFVLDVALEKPEGTIFLVPLRLENCQPPRRLRSFQHIDIFPSTKRELAYDRLMESLRVRANSLGIKTEKIVVASPNRPSFFQIVPSGKFTSNNHALYYFGGMEFVKIPKGSFLMGNYIDKHHADNNKATKRLVEIPYDYWMSRYLITNEQYNAFLVATRHKKSVNSLKLNYPVVNVEQVKASSFCRWLNRLLESDLPLSYCLRLPTEFEWEKAAQGTDERKWPWGNEFYKDKCNSAESGICNTTQIGNYSPQGDSPFGLTDMVGNVCEWTCTQWIPERKSSDKYGTLSEALSANRGIFPSVSFVIRGGSFKNSSDNVRITSRSCSSYREDTIGFRVVVAPVSNRRKSVA